MLLPIYDADDIYRHFSSLCRDFSAIAIYTYLLDSAREDDYHAAIYWFIPPSAIRKSGQLWQLNSRVYEYTAIQYASENIMAFGFVAVRAHWQLLMQTAPCTVFAALLRLLLAARF